MSTIVKPVCSLCGSDNIHTDAYAEWDIDNQKWDLSSTFDNTDCADCGNECSIEWVETTLTEIDTRYPECEKLRSVAPKSQIIGEFLDWLMEQGIGFSKYSEKTQYNQPYNPNIQDLLAQFFEVDLNKVEEERRQIIKDLGY